MNNLVEQVVRLLENITLKRVAVLVVLLVALAAGAFLFERYTASFAMTKMERAAALLRQLEQSQSAKAREKELAEISHQLTTQLHAIVVDQKVSSAVALIAFDIPPNVWLWKFIAAAAPWFLFSCAALTEVRKKPVSSLIAFFVAQVIVSFFGAVGALLPTIAWPWFNMFIFPSISLGVVALPAAIPAFRRVRESSQEKAITNNLRQISAAADQFFLERGVDYVRIGDLVGEGKFIKEITSVAGESYDLTIQQGQPITVVTKGGKRITYHN